MSSTVKTTGAPVPVTFYDKDGKLITLTCRPLSDVKISEVDEWLQARVIRTAQAALHKDMTPSERREVLDAAIDRSQGCSITSAEGARVLATVDGWAQMVYLMIRDDHPDMSVLDLRALMFNPENMREARRVWAKQNKVERAANPTNPAAGNRQQRLREKALKRKKA